MIQNKRGLEIMYTGSHKLAPCFPLILIFSLVLTLISPIFQAIAGPKEQPTSISDKDKTATIVFIPGIADAPFYLAMQAGIRQSAVDSGVNVVVQAPKTYDPAVQTTLINNLIKQGNVDYLIIAPTDREKLLPVLERAHEAGIPVITVDTFIGNGEYAKGSVTFPLSHIGSEHFQGGFMACEALAVTIGKGAKIYIENGYKGMRHTGRLEAGCRAAADKFGLNIVGLNYSKNKADLAQQHVTAALKEHPDLKGVICMSIADAEGAALAIDKAGPKRVQVAAFGATGRGIELLRKGTLTQVITQKPFEMGYLALTFAVAHAHGFYSIPPGVKTDFAVINADNVNDLKTSRLIYASMQSSIEPPLKDLTIAFVPGVNPDPFYITMAVGAKKAADLYGVTFVQRDPNAFNPTAQIPVIKSVLADHDVDYLITAPTEKNALIPILKDTHRKGIPVITVDTFIGNGDYVNGPVTFPMTYIGSDNVQGGYVGCSQLALAGLSGKRAAVYIQTFQKGSSTADQRVEGCVAAVNDFGLKLVAVDEADTTGTMTTGQTVASARDQTINILKKNPDIVGVFGNNTFVAQGAGEAVVEAGLGGTVEVVAFDASEFAVELLRKGVVTQVIAQKPADIGYLAVSTAVAHARGVSSIPALWSTGFEVINRTNIDKPGTARFVYKSE
jgi:ribose transport system substrate-binding protein